MCKSLFKESLLKLNTKLKRKEITDIVSVEINMEPLNNNDKLFITDLVSIKDFDSISWQHQWMHDFVGFSDKYSKSVDVLYNTIIVDSFCTNVIAYPLIFLARHTLELRLKSILCLLKANDMCKTHKLLDLWNSFSSIYEGNRKNFDILLKLIKEFNKMDEFSDGFRYPIYIDGQSTKKMEYIDIVNFYKVFKKIDYVLDGIESELLEKINY